MGRTGFFILTAALFILILLFIPATADTANNNYSPGITPSLRPVKVAVYEYPPFIYLGGGGSPSGFYIDVLENIAQKEGWSVTYVPGSWQEGLDRTASGEVDFLGLITHTKDRESSFEFSNETFFVTWGQLYTLRGSGIGDLPSLSGKKIAVLRGDIYYRLFSSYVNSFEINCTYIEADSYPDVFFLLENGDADAGLVDRVYGLLEYREDVFAPSAIVCCPIHLVMATPAGKGADLLDAFDVDLAELKDDHSSVYYTSLSRWFGNLPEKEVIPPWILWATGGILTVLVIGWAANMFLSTQVQDRTRELREEIEEHRKSEEALAANERKYRELFENANDAIFLHHVTPDGSPGKFIEVNRKACEKYGYTRDEFLSMTVMDINDPKYSGDLASIGSRLSTESHTTFEWAHITKQGSAFPVEISTHRFMMEGTEVALSVVRDITERKRFEEERKVAFARIEENMQEMAILNDEIRNPLSVIIAVADLLNSPDGREIIKQGKIINFIISRLDMGYLESEKVRSFLQRHSQFEKSGKKEEK